MLCALWCLHLVEAGAFLPESGYRIVLWLILVCLCPPQHLLVSPLLISGVPSLWLSFCVFSYAGCHPSALPGQGLHLLHWGVLLALPRFPLPLPQPGSSLGSQTGQSQDPPCLLPISQVTDPHRLMSSVWKTNAYTFFLWFFFCLFCLFKARVKTLSLLLTVARRSSC